MIITTLKGGLGNQLFQYAVGRALSIHLDTQLRLDISWFRRVTRSNRRYLLDRFNIRNDFITPHELDVLLHCDDTYHGAQKVKDLRKVEERNVQQVYFDPSLQKSIELLELKQNFVGNGCVFFSEPHFHFYPYIFNLTGSLYLDGYWQSEKYFKYIEGTLLSEFQLRVKRDPCNSKMVDRILDQPESVSLHVRRGDAITNPESREVHGCPSIRYYRKCIDIMAERLRSPHFFIFSDDIPWVRENMRLNQPYTVVNCNDEQRCYNDLSLMALCKHHIISASSFSWWGAWLAGKRWNNNPIVLAPEVWFVTQEFNTKDLYLPSWERISE